MATNATILTDVGRPGLTTKIQNKLDTSGFTLIQLSFSTAFDSTGAIQEYLCLIVGDE